MYKEYGWSEKNAAASANYVFADVIKKLKERQSCCVLDMGCGRGELVKLLLEEGFCAFGVDGSAEGVEIGNQACQGHFYVMNFETDELPDGLKEYRFDAIVATEVIEHLYSPKSYVELCNKILNVGGHIIITTPYHGYLKNLALAVTNKWDKHFTALWEGGHIKFWSKSSMSTLLKNAGFEVISFDGCGRIPYLWKSMIMVAIKTDSIIRVEN